MAIVEHILDRHKTYLSSRIVLNKTRIFLGTSMEAKMLMGRVLSTLVLFLDRQNKNVHPLKIMSTFSSKLMLRGNNNKFNSSKTRYNSNNSSSINRATRFTLRSSAAMDMPTAVMSHLSS